MGPTASGKTALAVDWVSRFNGEIISVDSALVYRRMDIGTAKPDAALQARAPHRLIDLREPHEAFSAADFVAAAQAAMDEVCAAGRLPLLVGGTGLYFHALLHGLSPMPEANAELRREIETEASQRGWAALHAELAAVDPDAAARIRPTDPQRIQRALEVWRLTGRPISDWQRASARRRFPFRVLRLALAPSDRSVLHRRIEQRFDAMLAAGFLDEVRTLRDDPRLHAGLPAIRAVGYRQAWAYLDGHCDVATFRAQAIAATRQLAKRQLTWLRSEYDVIWLDPDHDAERAQRLVARFAR